MSFKTRVREEIEYQGLSIKEAAAKANISNGSFLSYIDAREREPLVGAAVKIARALDTTVEYLVTGEDSKGADLQKYLPLRGLLDDLLVLPDEVLEPIKAMVHAAAEAERGKGRKI